MNGRLKSVLRSEAFVLFVVVLIGLTTLSIFTSQFLAVFNIYVLMYNIALAAIVAYGQMVVVATGGVNLSLGATGALSAVIMGMLMEWYGMPLVVVIVVGIAAGILMGWINGFLTVKTGIHPFVITLATASAYTGTTMAITNANPFYDIYDSVLSWAQARTGIFPWPAVVTIVVAVLLGLLFHRMVLGRQILAIGGNKQAAELTGVPVGRVIIRAHMISGFLAAIAGYLTMARVEAATPTIGTDWLLPSFAGIIIGGVLLEGGKVAIVAVLLGVTILELIANALAINRINPFWVTLLQGSLLLIAVILGQMRRGAKAVTVMDRRGARMSGGRI